MYDSFISDVFGNKELEVINRKKCKSKPVRFHQFVRKFAIGNADQLVWDAGLLIGPIYDRAVSLSPG